MQTLWRSPTPHNFPEPAPVRNIPAASIRLQWSCGLSPQNLQNLHHCSIASAWADRPLQLQILSVIAIGHKGMERKPFNEEHLQWEKIHINKFGGK